MRQAAAPTAAAAARPYRAQRARQPPHRLHVRPKAVSPRCFYPHKHTHTHSHKLTQISLRAL